MILVDKFEKFIEDVYLEFTEKCHRAQNNSGMGNTDLDLFSRSIRVLVL